MTRYVGVDLHRRLSVIVVLEADGTELWTTGIENDPLTLGLEIEKAGPCTIAFPGRRARTSPLE